MHDMQGRRWRSLLRQELEEQVPSSRDHRREENDDAPMRPPERAASASSGATAELKRRPAQMAAAAICGMRCSGSASACFSPSLFAWHTTRGRRSAGRGANAGVRVVVRPTIGVLRRALAMVVVLEVVVC